MSKKDKLTKSQTSNTCYN